jgi:hypothetical protein
MAQTLFPSIGTVADQTDNLQARETDGNVDDPASSTLSTNDSEEKIVQEMESLCMKCGEQVSLIYLFSFNESNFSVGNYASSPYVHTIFRRRDRDVFPLRTLWICE